MHVSIGWAMFSSISLLLVILGSVLFVSVAFWVLLFSIKKLFSFFQDIAFPNVLRIASGMLGVILLFFPGLLVYVLLESIISRVWIMIIDPVTGLVVGSAALIGFAGKKLNEYRRKKKFAEDAKWIVDAYPGDFEWDNVPFETKVKLAQHKKLFDRLLEKYSGADYDSTNPTVFVPDEIVELFADGRQPAAFVPYFPRFFIALHQYRELVRQTDNALVVAGDGMRGWIYTHIIKFQLHEPTEAFNSKQGLKYDKLETEKCIAQIEEFVRNVEYFLDYACKELGARGSRVFRARIHERAKRLYWQAKTIEAFISQMGMVQSAEEQRDLLIGKIENLCNTMLVDPADGVEVRVLEKGTQFFTGDAKVELDKKLRQLEHERAKLEQERIILEQARDATRREQAYYLEKKTQAENSIRLLENQRVVQSVPLQLTHQVDEASPFSQPLPSANVVTTFVAPLSIVPDTDTVLGNEDEEASGEHEVIEPQRAIGS
jgi:hypothetical protein